MSSTKDKIIKGGLWLTLRENINLIIRSLGIFILLKFINPEQYGIYAIIIGIYTFVSQIANLGVNTYIVRYKGVNLDGVVKNSTLLLIILSGATLVLALAAIPFLAKIVKVPNLCIYAGPLFITIPLSIMGVIPLGIAERSLKFKEISKMEMVYQSMFFLISIPLASVFKFGVGSMIIASIIMALYYFCNLLFISTYKFEISYDKTVFFDILKFGISYAIACFGWQLRLLVLPLIIAPAFNAHTVGIISLANRIAESLNIIRDTMRRIALNAIAQVQDNSDKCKRILLDGISYQIISLWAILFIFILLAPYCLEFVLNKKWVGILGLLPYVAAYTLYNSFNTIPTAFLYIKDKTYYVAGLFFVQHILIILGAYFLTKEFGIVGYAYSILIPLPLILLLIYVIQKCGDKINFTIPLLWFFCLTTSLFFVLSKYLLLLCLIPIFNKKCRNQIAGLYHLIRYRTI